MKTRTWKVYGAEGHRQRESFRTADNYIEFLMKQGQEKTGGIVEI